MASDERAAVPVVWCPECKTGNAPYDDLGCCCKCLCPVELRHVVTDADMRVLEDITAIVGEYDRSSLKPWGRTIDRIRAALARRGAKPIEPCPACGPGPCTPACPEREWRYAPRKEESMNKAEYKRRFEAMERQLKLEGASLGHAMGCASLLAMEYTNARWQEALLVIARKLGSDKDWETVIEEARKKLAE